MDNEAADAALLAAGISSAIFDREIDRVIEASHNGWDDVVDVILEARTFSTRSAQSALIAASFYGHDTVVEMLIRTGVGVDKTCPLGFTALQKAVYNGHITTARLLLAAGARTDIRGNDGKHVMHQAMGPNGTVEMVRLLLDAGAYPDPRCNRGCSPLHIAAHYGRDMGLVLAAGAEVDARDNMGRTPLHMAAFWGKGAALTALLRAGACPVALNNGGLSPLGMVGPTTPRAGRIVELLLDAGADPGCGVVGQYLSTRFAPALRWHARSAWIRCVAPIISRTVPEGLCLLWAGREQ